MEISIIVPALNEEDHIKACLKSILNQDFPRKDYEIIVSDGNSSDKTVEIARKYADKVVVSKKKGIWYGRNFGAKFAKGKYLVFIDADTMIKKDYLKTVHNYLETGIAGITAGFELSGRGARIKFLEHLANIYWAMASVALNCTLNGINLGVPKDIFDKAGGFKNCTLEDMQINRDLKKFGKLIFLRKKLAITSTRRLDEYGTFGICRYYFELFILDSGLTNKLEPTGLIKYQAYVPVRKSKSNGTKPALRPGLNRCSITQ